MISRYHFAQISISFMTRLFWGLKPVYMAKNEIGEGPYFVISNHTSYFDPPLIGAFFPPEMLYIAKKELFSIPVLGKIITKYNSIPVDREQLDLSTIKTILRTVREKKISVLIFPEGTRKPQVEFESFKRGAIALAQKLALPIVPVYISYPRNKWLAFFRIQPIVLKYGVPIDWMSELDKNPMPDPTTYLLDRVIDAIRQLMGVTHS